MKMSPVPVTAPIAEQEWLAFPGGELEGRRPRTLCPRCRASLTREVPSELKRRSICFDCYKADVKRERALAAAAGFNAASEERFQNSLPFEPVDRVRLMQLKAARSAARVEAKSGIGQYVDRRRKAQISARHTL